VRLTLAAGKATRAGVSCLGRTGAHSGPDSPNDGWHRIVWGDEAKPSVMIHEPAALLCSNSGKEKRKRPLSGLVACIAVLDLELIPKCKLLGIVECGEQSPMATRRKIELFSAGCALCNEVARRSSSEVIVRNMIDPRVLSRAEESGTIRSGIPDRWQVGVLLCGG
jgi:hypothetical protein